MATNVITGILSGSLTAGAKYRLVTKATATTQKQVDATGSMPYGVTTERFEAGDTMSLWAPGSTSVPCECGGTFEVGDALMSDDKGRLIAAVQSGNNWGCGTAESAGASGKTAYFTFNLVRFPA